MSVLSLTFVFKSHFRILGKKSPLRILVVIGENRKRGKLNGKVDGSDK
jgi:hypothetical protein